MYEVVDCGLKQTSTQLPWAMAGHSCATAGNAIFICGSEVDFNEKNCTIFDGNQVPVKYHMLSQNTFSANFSLYTVSGISDIYKETVSSSATNTNRSCYGTNC